MPLKRKKTLHCQLDFEDERAWQHDYLKKKCKEVELENDYFWYVIRLRNTALLVFMILHTILTLTHCILLLTTCEYTKLIKIDVISYAGANVAIILVLYVNFYKNLVFRQPWILYFTSIVAAFILVFVDLTINIVHVYQDDWILGSFYDTYILYMIYMFLPIPYIKGPLILGCTVSFLYILYFLIYLSTKYQYEFSNASQYYGISIDTIHYVCFNMLGAFFRLMSDIIVRSSFLDRHQYVMEDIALRSARKQEKLLLHSILPPQIALPIQEDIRNRIANAERPQRITRDHIMAVQMHPEVSILYADVVNYTHLTTTLSVKNLVRLLHDLFARFDLAASSFSVQRIKFLGDCYYCVGGLTKPNPEHASSCVDLGLCMIENIREVRAERNLNIDMRIGVHSGGLFAGVIGRAKLQFDIWGRDVMIANRLESTGLAGHIHISKRTLDMMTSHTHEILPPTEAAQNDAFLQKYGIETFLIAAAESGEFVKRGYDLDQLESVNVMKVASKTQLREESVIQELREEFKKLPSGAFIMRKFRCRRYQKGRKLDSSRPMLGALCLNYRDARLEYNYIHQPDYMLKYSILLAWFIGICLVYIQMVNSMKNVLVSYLVNITLILTMSSLVFITWYKRLCYWRFAANSDHVFTPFSCFMFRLADRIQHSLPIRICIYMYILVIYYSVISLMLMGCNRSEYILMHIEGKLYHYEPDLRSCFHPWVLTNIVCLVIGMSIIFTRIPMIVKLIASIVEALAYLIIILFQYDYIVHQSPTTNPYFISEYAHSILVVTTLFSLSLMERQTEFNNKVNFNWRIELAKKQRDADLANESITILLHNILPSHVVSVYLTSLAKGELYYEDYKMVAVMFATLKKFDMDLANLRVLNEIISEFDSVLKEYRSVYMVEKIKIVGCTYMAACGLDVRFSGRMRGDSGKGRESLPIQISRSTLLDHDDHVSELDVSYVMTSFALDLMRTLAMCTNYYKNMVIKESILSSDMSIGISSGEVMAGVVGASQVHYDIWGDAVNMASRMDSTGIAGHIQVTEETALTLRKNSVDCEYRGLTYVKGRGLMPTYFVGITEDFEFKFTQEESDPVYPRATFSASSEQSSSQR
ncbi:ACXA [Drosophila busckii]|uniref:adenylate cyclase n=1 Tax=Drosophila busckii TaxID=30019 RepID=A0A0M5IYV0_DROBS|nr:adenylyl cyclase X E [Drosophila busckii]ALC44268.1 ACXA [Drosophila busckii]